MDVELISGEVVPVNDPPEITSHATRVEALLERLVTAVEKNTEAVKEVAEAGRQQAKVQTKASTAQRVAQARDTAGKGGGRVKER